MSEECGICLTAFREADGPTIQSCRHKFHTACIEGWLKRQQTCPLCRLPIVLPKSQAVSRPLAPATAPALPVPLPSGLHSKSTPSLPAPSTLHSKSTLAASAPHVKSSVSPSASASAPPARPRPTLSEDKKSAPAPGKHRIEMDDSKSESDSASSDTDDTEYDELHGRGGWGGFMR